MISAMDVANYFTYKAAADDENDLTNLKLQKLLYFSQADFFKKYSTPLFNEDIEAWQYGPVIREVYEKYRVCGSYPISYFELDDSQVELAPEIEDFLDESYQKWNKFSSSYLVTLSHKQGDPWSKYFQKSNPKIPVEELVNVTATA
jgi:uncharacterized phage-associated protein